MEVLKPVFSLSGLSSELSLINFFTLLSFLSSSLEILWSTDNAQNDAPKIVSGLVVNTFK